MKTTQAVDSARISLLLNELRLPAIKLVWSQVAEQADKEGWPAARFLAAIAEHELAERGRRRIERHLAEARLPPGKTLDTFDFETVPMLSRRRSWPSPPATAGWPRAPTCSCSAHPAAEKATWPQPLALP
jgi:DNA replication protein DnaC